MLKRATLRDNNAKTYLEPEADLLGLRQEDVVGWLANKYNMAFGWVLLNTTTVEKSEFGQDALRTYNCRTNTTSIIKVNPLTGTYAFLDNEAYLDGEIKYEKMEAYNRLVMDDASVFRGES